MRPSNFTVGLIAFAGHVNRRESARRPFTEVA